MKQTYTLETVISIGCKNCYHESEGSTLKRAYFWVIWHLRFHCKGTDRKELPNILTTLWQLWRWKP